MTAHTEKANTGILLTKRRAPTSAGVTLDPAPLARDNRVAASANASPLNRLAFAGLWLFTCLLFGRPNEILPINIAEFPFVKIVGVLTLLAYLASKLGSGEGITIFPIEMKMLAVIVMLALILTPVAVAPQRSVNMLTDTFFKVITIFVLMINLINTRWRLYSIMKLVVFCGALIAITTIKGVVEGKLDISRVAGPAPTAGGLYANLNDLAIALDLLLPLALILAMKSKGLARAAYAGCAFLFGVAVVLTFSRGGFLGLVALGGVVLWKAGRGRRALSVLAAVLLLGVFLTAMPSGYSDRLFTILNTQEDTTNSAQQRQAILMRGLAVAAAHPVIGVGLGNFPEYSHHQAVAHNSYIEIACELGGLGLIAYLIFAFAPTRSLSRIESEIFAGRGGHAWTAGGREMYFLSIGLQATMVACLVCSFFASIQYFWFPYYAVAYAVSLNRIYAIEQASSAQTNLAVRQSEGPAASTGNLWKLRRPRTDPR